MALDDSWVTIRGLINYSNAISRKPNGAPDNENVRSFIEIIGRLTDFRPTN